MIQRHYQQRIQTVMNKFRIIILLFIFFNIQFIFSQKKENCLDTIIIIFDEKFEEFEKVKYTSASFSVSKEKPINSFEYTVEQMEEDTWSDSRFKFAYHIQSQETLERFNIKRPIKLKKHKLYLDRRRVLDIEFFQTTAYNEVAKTFEEEDSWQQDVMIFIADVDEMENDSIVLKEVKFSRPVKQ